MDLSQNFVGGRNRRMQEMISGTGETPFRPADWLLKVNLPPLMGRRDATFDIAERLICEGKFAEFDAHARFAAYWKISRLLKQVCSDSRQIMLMLNNPDTRERERRMLAHSTMLETLGATLAHFFELRDMMMTDTFRDTMFTVEQSETDELISSLNSVEADLLSQLRANFDRSHWRVARYRTYAGKNFSPVNAGRYRLAYSATVTRNMPLLTSLSVTLEQEIQL